jgi:hypothetical protein
MKELNVSSGRSDRSAAVAKRNALPLVGGLAAVMVAVGAWLAVSRNAEGSIELASDPAPEVSADTLPEPAGGENNVAIVREHLSVDEPSPVSQVSTGVEVATNGGGAKKEVKERSPGQIYREEFGHWKSLARDQGILVPADLQLSDDQIALFVQAFQEYDASMSELKEAWGPLVGGIADRKAAARDYEEFVNPESLSGTDAAEARKALRAARKPTVPGQIIVVGGDAKTIRLTRVNPSDASAFPVLIEARDGFNRNYVIKVCQGIGLSQR